MYKLLVLEVFIKSPRKIFIYPLSQGKLLGKDNVGGNEALRVNLLSVWSARHRLGEILIEKKFAKKRRKTGPPQHTDLCPMQCIVI